MNVRKRKLEGEKKEEREVKSEKMCEHSDTFCMQNKLESLFGKFDLVVKTSILLELDNSDC